MLTALAGPSAAEDLKPTTIAVGTTALNVSYSFLTLPKTLGYWVEEGYDVTVEPVGASLQAVQQMVAGNAEFAQINASVIVQSNIQNKLPLRVVETNTMTDWTISVPAGSPLKSVQDLKGKTIGVFSLATGGIPLLNSYLSENGMAPSDVSLVPLGMGAAPVDALKTGKVDALLYWAAATTLFENAGLELSKTIPESWQKLPDYSLSTLQATIDKEPEKVIGIARGMVKAMLFISANPECTVKLHWAHYPETKPTGVDEATALKRELRSVELSAQSYAKAFAAGGGKYWGGVDPAGFDALQKLLKENGVIAGAMLAEDYLTKIPDFFQKINDFDAEAIRASAKACEAAR